MEKQAQVQTAEKPVKKQNKVLKIINRVVMAVLIVAILGLLFIYFSPNYDFFYVKSGSMRPGIDPGDIVITGPVGGWFTGGLKVGKVITFKDFDTIVTHRIVGIENGMAQTKGDANEDADIRRVALSNVKGIYMFKIPFLGYINGFVSNRAGWFIVIIIPTILLILFLVKDIIKEALKDDKKKEQTQTKGGEVYQGMQKNEKQAEDTTTKLDQK